MVIKTIQNINPKTNVEYVIYKYMWN